MKTLQTFVFILVLLAINSVLLRTRKKSNLSDKNKAQVNKHFEFDEVRLYVDIFTDDVVLSDEFEIVEEYGNSILSVKSKLVNANDDEENCITNGGCEEEQGQLVNNIISRFSLIEYNASKNQISSLFKEKIIYMREKLRRGPLKLRTWESGGVVEKFIRYVFEKYENCKFYMGSSYADNEQKVGMPIISLKNENDITETFYYFKDGYKIIRG